MNDRPANSAIPDLAPLGDGLPEELTERVCRFNGVGPRESGEFVLHWMTCGARAHEQPALDLAIVTANRLGLPVLSLQALSERVPFASDRHWAFALGGAVELSAECEARGVQHRFHLERDGHRGSPLKGLVERAALVVVDEMPVPPLVDWTRRLLRFGREVGVPVLSVDTSCIVPMALGPTEPARAFKFRDKTKKLRAARIDRTWAEPSVDHRDPILDLPFEPLDLERVRHEPATLRELLSQCMIDHSVAPVRDTPGGATAGYARWEWFLGRIRHYAGTRNDPTKHGVSRMSAYLHHGQVSPFRLTREANERGGKGPEKYLDELLIWRELAWHWAFRQEQVHAASAIPEWARETLDLHRHDPRELLLLGEDAARGRSGDDLWDLCQASLVRHGELHNNLRMTWGKALVAWSPSPESAVKRLVDLNHRFALDGRDPSSYGGLYWCVGLFDRPFEPEQPVIGTLRPRPTEEHAARLRMDAYRQIVTRPIGASAARIAVVGAGIAGSVCTRALKDHGLDVAVFDKGRGPGGRMSTRRVALDDRELQFDHGAQYFTARDRRFRRAVAHWIEAGAVAPWRGRFPTLRAGVEGPDPNPGPRYVGAPTMNAIVRHLQRDLEVSFGTRIGSISRVGERWALRSEDGRDLGAFDLVLAAIPFPQAEDLLSAHQPAFGSRFEDHTVLPSICTMVAFERSLGIDWNAAFVEDDVLSWIARDGSKPGRSGAGEQMVLHSTGAWAEEVLEQGPDEWIPAMLEAFSRTLGQELPDALHTAAHRWRYALPTGDGGSDASFDESTGLGLAGDACTGGRVEGAFLSGQDLAGRVLRFLTLRTPTRAT